MSFFQRLDRLTDILDFATQISVFTFSKGQEFDQGYSVPSGTIAVPGALYGYDAIGVRAAPLAVPRKTTWRFVHIYNRTDPTDTWPALKDSMMRAFGHHRIVWLRKVRPDGTALLCEARLADFPDRPTIDGEVLAEFTVTFDQLGDWMSQQVPSLTYDTGQHYDTGLHYDIRGLQILCTGVETDFAITNNGSVNAREVFLELIGPMTGPLQWINGSVDVQGIPFSPAAPDPTRRMTTTFNISLATGQYFAMDTRTNTFGTNVPGIVPWSVVTRAFGQRAYAETGPGVNNCAIIKADSAAAGSAYMLIHDTYR